MIGHHCSCCGELVPVYPNQTPALCQKCFLVLMDLIREHRNDMEKKRNLKGENTK